jgi:hypothetical protein
VIGLELLEGAAAGGQSGGDALLDDDDASSADVLFHFRNSPHDEPVAFTAKMIAGPIPLPKNELEALASEYTSGLT